MTISIRTKLFTALLFSILLVVGVMALVVQWGFDKGFLEYINKEELAETRLLAGKLEQYYGDNRSWQALEQDPLIVFVMHAEITGSGSAKHRLKAIREKKQHDDDRPPKTREKKEDRHRFSIERTIILDQSGRIIFGEQLQPKLPHMIPIMHEGMRVGSIGLYLPEKLSEANQVTFIEQQSTFMITALLISVLIAVAVSIFLAFSLTRPIRRLSRAAQKVTHGDYSARVTTGNGDELDQLSHDFNAMTATLQENEEQRKRWVSDIAHELRTPLTSLKGQIEGLQDGIRKPDLKTYDSLHQGVSRLERLVEDLYDLNRSDIGAFTMIKKEINFSQLVETEVTSFRQEAAKTVLTLKQNIGADIYLLGDVGRLQQLLDNLLTNSLRYTDSGGEVQITLTKDKNRAQLEIADSSPGVPEESLPRLFQRLYRVEESRNRALGGSGLGLAICKEIVLAHNGTISARHSSIGGVSVMVTLPLLKR